MVYIVNNGWKNVFPHKRRSYTVIQMQLNYKICNKLCIRVNVSEVSMALCQRYDNNSIYCLLFSYVIKAPTHYSLPLFATEIMIFCQMWAAITCNHMLLHSHWHWLHLASGFAPLMPFAVSELLTNRKACNLEVSWVRASTLVSGLPCNLWDESHSALSILTITIVRQLI